MKRHFVYILCSYKKGTLYIGVTNNLSRRIYEHQQKLIPSFCTKYDVSMLVHAEEFSMMKHAIDREKALKKWKRQWKINLIESKNPDWQDLSRYLMFSDERN